MKSFKNNGRKHYVLAMAKDGDDEIMTTKYYFRNGSNSRWCYAASTMLQFETLKAIGSITDIK